MTLRHPLPWLLLPLVLLLPSGVMMLVRHERAAGEADLTPWESSSTDGDPSPGLMGKPEDLRLATAPTKLREPIERLVALRAKWLTELPERLRGDEEAATLHRELAWSAFANETLSNWQDEVLEPLLAWMLEKDIGCGEDDAAGETGGIDAWRHPVVRAMASRWPQGVREQLLLAATRVRRAESEEQEASRQADWTALYTGFGEADPAEALKVYPHDYRNPAVLPLLDDARIISAIETVHAVRAPEEVWKTVLTSDDPETIGSALDGFWRGAPAGLDWDARMRTLLATEAMPYPFRSYGIQCLALRWLLEDPAKALAGYARMREELTMPEEDNPYPEATPPEGEDPRLDLLEALRDDPKTDRTAQLATVLRKLLDTGDARQAALVTAFIRRQLNAFSEPELIDVLSQLPDTEARALMILGLIDSFSKPAPDGESPGREWTPQTASRLRRVVGRLALPADARREAVAGLDRLDAGGR